MTSAVSLYVRLTGLLLVLLAVLGVVAYWYADQRSGRIVERNVDDQLMSGAVMILAATSASGAAPGPAMRDVTPGERMRAVVPAFEVSDAEGALIAASADFPTTLGQTEDGFSDRVTGTTGWRILTVRDTTLGLNTRLAVDMADTERLARETRTELLAPVIAILVMIAMLVLAAIWIGLRPLRQIETAIGRLDPVRMTSLDLDAGAMPRELARLTQTLDDLLARLQKLMRHQKTFVSAAGHELRTPLAGCSTQLEVARRAPGPEQRDRALEKLGQGLSRMGTLVDQLMIIARSEQSVLRETASVFSLDDLLEEIRDTLSSEDDRVTLRIDTRPIRLAGHPDLIRSMVVNIVRNALRASPPDEPVDISLHATREGARIEVRDRGPGMDADQKSSAFDSFHSKSGGTGLGLAIANAVIQAHEGQIDMRDRRPRGLCVVVTLPALS